MNAEIDELEMKILAKPDSPLVNPAFIIKDWGDYELELDINSNQIPMEDYKYSLKRNLNSKDLLIWLIINEATTTNLNIKRINKL